MTVSTSKLGIDASISTTDAKEHACFDKLKFLIIISIPTKGSTLPMKCYGTKFMSYAWVSGVIRKQLAPLTFLVKVEKAFFGNAIETNFKIMKIIVQTSATSKSNSGTEQDF